jgi:hypothetical protein
VGGYTPHRYLFPEGALPAAGDSWPMNGLALTTCATLLPSSSWCSRSSELFRQEFSVDSFLKPPTVFHTGLVDAPAPQFNGEFRSAKVCKYVRSS